MPPASMRTSTSRGPSGAAATVSMRRSFGAYSTAARMVNLTGRIALITGSSRGIGRAIAEGYVAAGARVIVNGRDAAGVAAAVKAIGASALAAPFDVTSSAAVEAAVARIERDIGAIDILVNNAGMTKRMPFTEF